MLSLSTWTPFCRLMRLEKPIGTHLVFLPAAWGASLALESLGGCVRLCAVLLGIAVVLRGAGCTINDMMDVEFDKQVARTRSRPLPSGEVTMLGATMFLLFQLMLAYVFLLQLNEVAILATAIGMIPVFLYPMMKRVTYYPQIFLGFTINWGMIVGYVYTKRSVDASLLCLYCAAWSWTFIYDTIYAHQDKADDIRAGVKSSALALGSHTRQVLGCASCVMLGFLFAAGILSNLSVPYFVGTVLAFLEVAKLVETTDFDDPKACWGAFVENSRIGAMIWLAIVAGRVL